MMSFEEVKGYYNMSLVTASKVVLKYYKFDNPDQLLDWVEEVISNEKPFPPETPHEIFEAMQFSRYWRRVMEILTKDGKVPIKEGTKIKLTN